MQDNIKAQKGGKKKKRLLPSPRSSTRDFRLNQVNNHNRTTSDLFGFEELTLTYHFDRNLKNGGQGSGGGFEHWREQ